MHAAGKLPRQSGIDHPVAFQPALTGKRGRHDIDAKMRFTARPVARMPFVLMRLVHHIQALGSESLG
jgi:hypothetical protein